MAAASRSPRPAVAGWRRQPRQRSRRQQQRRHAGPVPHLAVRGHAAADPGRHRHPVLRGLRRGLSHRRGPRCGAAGPGDVAVERPRLLQQGPQPACRCQAVVERHGGAFPRTADELATLPGVGRSTAAAIAAFAFGERAAILDGNVKRVFCRVFAVEGSPTQASVMRELWLHAQAELPVRAGAGETEQAGCIRAYTQGLMDLGATALHAEQACLRPLSARRPNASPGAAMRSQDSRRRGRGARCRCARSTCCCLCSGESVLIEQRPPVGIWGGLWSLPEIRDRGGAARYRLPASRCRGAADAVHALRARLHPLPDEGARLARRTRRGRGGEGAAAGAAHPLACRSPMPRPRPCRGRSSRCCSRLPQARCASPSRALHGDR